MCRVRILWHSNLGAPWTGTGYGQQTALWAPRLASLGHTVIISAFWGLTGTTTEWLGHQVLCGGQHDYGADILPAHCRAVKADLAITLMDAFVLDPAQLTDTDVLHWMPVDCAPLSALNRKYLAASGKPAVAMSHFGGRMLAEAGFAPRAVIPHAVNLEVFKPPEDRAAVRRAYGIDDRFVVGINAANKSRGPDRKGFAEQLLAFSRFRKKHPEALLLIHALSASPAGVDLEPLISDLGIAGDVILTDPYLYLTGKVSPADLARWYGALDVYANCSYGEGFGLGVLEAQACGTPVVITDCSAMSELCGAGWKVSGEPWWHTEHKAWWLRPSPSQITRAFEKAWQGAAARRPQARQFALGYDPGKILAGSWKPLLDSLEHGTSA